MDFGEALVALKNNEKVARTRWVDEKYVALSPGFELTADRVFSAPIQDEIGEGVGVFKPYLMKRTSDGDFVPWVPSQTDLLSEDWAVV